MKPQATRIEQQKPNTSFGEKIGCIAVAILFMAMICIVYAIPYVFAWSTGVL